MSEPSGQPAPSGQPEHLDVGPTTPPDGGQRPRWIAITAVVVLVALGLGGLGGFLIARSSSAAQASDESVATACAMADRLEKLGTIDDWTLQSPEMWQAMAIGPLLHAAALDNPDHEQLGQAGDDLLSSTQRLDTEQFDAAMSKINRLCAEI